MKFLTYLKDAVFAVLAQQQAELAELQKAIPDIAALLFAESAARSGELG
ncbi:MAG TPA: hypothetical protein V6D18_07325 [Thermosynechococcaceae cyanobacterium]